jgi:hypothetical protein
MSEQGETVALRFAALGPLIATADGRVLELGGPVPRRVLAVLVTSDGLRASDQQLAERVWDERGSDWPRHIDAPRTTVARLNRVPKTVGVGQRILREVGDFIFTGDLFNIRNRAWLVAHMVAAAVALGRGLHKAMADRSTCHRSRANAQAGGRFRLIRR